VLSVLLFEDCSVQKLVLLYWASLCCCSVFGLLSHVGMRSSRPWRHLIDVWLVLIRVRKAFSTTLSYHIGYKILHNDRDINVKHLPILRTCKKQKNTRTRAYSLGLSVAFWSVWVSVDDVADTHAFICEQHGVWPRPFHHVRAWATPAKDRV